MSDQNEGWDTIEVPSKNEGSEIESCGQEGNWLRLTAACWIRLTGRQVRGAAWMMIDGAEVGLGPLLVPVSLPQQHRAAA